MLLTKSDKLARAEQKAALEQVRSALSADYPATEASVQLFSAREREGISEAQEVIASWLNGEAWIRDF